MKCIIAGSRTVSKRQVREALLACPFLEEITEVVSGAARGVDTHGEELAKELGLKVTRFPADWDRFGKSAGYRRNVEMATYADALIAVWDGESRGTRHMIDIATERGLRVFVHRVKVIP